MQALTQRLEDLAGFLTPFKLRRIVTTLDDYTYVPDDIVLEGEVERGQYFRESDFNVTVEIREREEFRVKQFLSEIQPLEKTLVFCANQRHALLIRDIINQQKSVKEPDYCVRVTADDGELGEEFLRKFQDNEKSIPAILTTSHKLSTGVIKGKYGGSITDGLAELGDISNVRGLFVEMQQWLYR